jgi:hypothetical protein
MVKYILNAARGKFHYDLLCLLTVDDVQEKAQYHSTCITNYLLKWKKDHSADNYSTIKNESVTLSLLTFYHNRIAVMILKPCL